MTNPYIIPKRKPLPSTYQPNIHGSSTNTHTTTLYHPQPKAYGRLAIVRNMNNPSYSANPTSTQPSVLAESQVSNTTANIPYAPLLTARQERLKKLQEEMKEKGYMTADRRLKHDDGAHKIPSSEEWQASTTSIQILAIDAGPELFMNEAGPQLKYDDGAAKHEIPSKSKEGWQASTQKENKPIPINPQTFGYTEWKEAGPHNKEDRNNSSSTISNIKSQLNLALRNIKYQVYDIPSPKNWAAQELELKDSEYGGGGKADRKPLGFSKGFSKFFGRIKNLGKTKQPKETNSSPTSYQNWETLGIH